MGMISDFFGAILNLIFEGVATVLPIATLGVSIIVFTVVVQLLLTPLKLKQQRTTRAMARIQPAMKKIQDKYQGKKDQESQLRYSEEMNAIYKKHKISPFSGCLPLLIQLPIMYSLFSVLRHPSKYIASLNNIYTGVATILMDKVVNYQSLLVDSIEVVSQRTMLNYDLTSITATAHGSGLSDLVSQLNSSQWSELLLKIPSNPELTLLLERKHDFEWFLVNLIDTPAQLFQSGNIFALLVPLIAGASTFIFSKTTMAATQATQPQGDGPNQTQSMMKTMNIMMPIMTGTFAYTMPVGLALYWISGNLIMMVQQIFVNKIVEKEEAIAIAQMEKEKKEQEPEKPVRKKRNPSNKNQTSEKTTTNQRAKTRQNRKSPEERNQMQNKQPKKEQ
jgi:YidC/Oxa1 family membrane protein insertase